MTGFLHYGFLAYTRSRMTIAITFPLQNDAVSRTSTT